MRKKNFFISVPDFKFRVGGWVRSSDYRDYRITTVSGDKFNNMIARCSGRLSAQRWPTYAECAVEFEGFQDFVEWHREQTGYGSKGWHLDKDILVRGSRVYSRQTCCLVPEPVNKVLLKTDAQRGLYPIGVSWNEPRQKFVAQLNRDGRRTYLGRYLTITEAFIVYKQAKEAQIKEVARRYREMLDPRVFDALMRYEVEITD